MSVHAVHHGDTFPFCPEKKAQHKTAHGGNEMLLFFNDVCVICCVYTRVENSLKDCLFFYLVDPGGTGSTSGCETLPTDKSCNSHSPVDTFILPVFLPEGDAYRVYVPYLKGLGPFWIWNFSGFGQH